MPEEKEVAKSNSKGWSRHISALSRSPWLTLSMAVLTVFSVGFAYYVWIDSRATRQLKYYVNPARAVVVEQGKASGLAVAFNGEKIAGNITAAQVAIWNDGKLPVKSSEMLKGFVLQMGDGIPILEATVRNPGREVCRLALDTSEIGKGRLYVNWAILERGDLGIIQVIYAGNSLVPITGEAIIEGQKDVINPKIHTATTPGELNVPGPLGLVLWVMIAMVLFSTARTIWKDIPILIKSLVLIFCFTALSLLAYGVYQSFTVETALPFSFE